MLQNILDSSRMGILQGEPGAALTLLYAGLGEAQRWDARSGWRDLIREVCLPHPLTKLIRQDPCLGRHPCSAAGGDINAFLESLLYRVPVTDADALTPLGQRLFLYTVDASVARAARCRRRYVAHLIDSAAQERAGLRVLALGADHLRAVDLSLAMATGAVRDFVAVDDRETVLARIEKAHATAGVRTQRAPLTAYSHGEADFGDLGMEAADLILCPSLFSRLSRASGRRFARALWDLVRPGGQLFIACMLDENSDVAFWECYAGWEPHLRSRREVVELIDQIPCDSITGLTLDTDPDKMLAFLVLGKEAAEAS